MLQPISSEHGLRHFMRDAVEIVVQSLIAVAALRLSQLHTFRELSAEEMTRQQQWWNFNDTFRN